MTSRYANNVDIESVKKTILFVEPLEKDLNVNNKLSMDYIYKTIKNNGAEDFQKDVYYLFGGWLC